MRIPEATLIAALTELFGGADLLPALGEIRSLPETDRVPFGGAQAVTTSVAFLVESVFAGKLGVADLLVAGELHGHARAAALGVDVVPDEATGEDELTFMLTLAVDLAPGGFTAFPPSVPSYSRWHWVAADRLRDALDRNDVMHLVPDIDLMVCLHGLCVRSAAEVIRSELGAVPGGGRP